MQRTGFPSMTLDTTLNLPPGSYLPEDPGSRTPTPVLLGLASLLCTCLQVPIESQSLSAVLVPQKCSILFVSAYNSTPLKSSVSAPNQ